MNRKRTLRLIRALLLAVIIVCLAKIGQAYFLTKENAALQDELKRIKTSGISPNIQGTEMPEETESEEIPTKGLDDLTSINGDLAGWLSIEGTNIDYPVMRHTDDDYYLTHDFYRKESRHGSLFIKSWASFEPPDTNVVIYGHNMKDGSMFGDLDRYKDESFGKDHPFVTLELADETRVYQIMSAFRQDLADETGGFAYYNFRQAKSEEDFQNFYKNVKKLSLYDTGITAEWGDEFLTLSTCDYYAKEGRFVIVAKQLPAPYCR